MYNAAVISQLLRKEARAFVLENKNENPQKLRLKYHGKTGLPFSACIDQIEAVQRLRKKNPDWALNLNLLFPPKLNVEQSSSTEAANYKSQLIKGKTFIDLTGGMGIDTLAISRQFLVSHYCDINPTLCLLAMHNFEQLSAKIKVHHKNGFEVLEKNPEVFDCAFIDPARRIEGKRMVSLSGCEPNILAHLPLLFKKAKQVLVKVSPLLDITAVKAELPNIKEIHVVSVKNDCKELLFLLEPNFTEEPQIVTINLTSPKRQILKAQPKAGNCKTAEVKAYLYEPNASIMKAALFAEICENFKIEKLHPNTHLFTSDEKIENFPGKIFKVSDIFRPFKKSLKGEQLNVVCRNFNLKPEQIKNKAKTKDGGARYLFACTLLINKKAFILAERLF